MGIEDGPPAQPELLEPAPTRTRCRSRSSSMSEASSTKSEAGESVDFSPIKAAMEERGEPLSLNEMEPRINKLLEQMPKNGTLICESTSHSAVSAPASKVAKEPEAEQGEDPVSLAEPATTTAKNKAKPVEAPTTGQAASAQPRETKNVFETLLLHRDVKDLKSLTLGWAAESAYPYQYTCKVYSDVEIEKNTEVAAVCMHIPPRQRNMQDENNLRWMQTTQIRKFLKADYSVTYMLRGWSLDPVPRHGDQCTFDPIYNNDIVHVGDVVVCEPQRNWILVHKVLRIAQGATGRKSDKWFRIGNENGHGEVWAKGDQLYGRLVVVRSER